MKISNISQLLGFKHSLYFELWTTKLGTYYVPKLLDLTEGELPKSDWVNYTEVPEHVLMYLVGSSGTPETIRLNSTGGMLDYSMDVLNEYLDTIISKLEVLDTVDILKLIPDLNFDLLVKTARHWHKSDLFKGWEIAHTFKTLMARKLSEKKLIASGFVVLRKHKSVVSKTPTRDLIINFHRAVAEEINTILGSTFNNVERCANSQFGIVPELITLCNRLNITQSSLTDRTKSGHRIPKEFLEELITRDKQKNLNNYLNSNPDFKYPTFKHK